MNFIPRNILFGLIFIFFSKLAYSGSQPGDYPKKMCDKARSGQFEIKGFATADSNINSYLLECAISPYDHEVPSKKESRKSKYGNILKNKQKTADYFIYGSLDLRYKNSESENLVMSVVMSDMPVPWKEKAIALLSKKGVDLAEKNRDGQTALDLARIGGIERIVNVIYWAQAGDFRAKLCGDAISGQFEIKGFPTADSNFNSYLLTCSIKSYISEVSLVNPVQYGNILKYKQKAADYFISGPLDLSYKDDGGRNLLMSVVVSDMPVAWKKNAITFFLKEGVDLAEKDRNGHTASDLAKIRGDVGVVNFLSR